MLTVIFFPDSSEALLESKGFNTPSGGNVLVHFDGVCVSDSGDRIVLAASDTLNWSVNSGSTESEAFNSDVNENSFSHTRVYPALTNNKDVYATAENFYETEGNGIATIYGSLTAVYFPDQTTSAPEVSINKQELNIFPNPVSSFASVSFNIPRTQNVKLEVFDMTGRLIKTPSESLYSFNRSVNEISSGIIHSLFLK